MRTPPLRRGQTYQLILSEDGRGQARTIEFEANAPDMALYLAQQQCAGREAELRENGRSLGILKCERAGFWVISPQPDGDDGSA